jgi:hypothetical protein
MHLVIGHLLNLYCPHGLTKKVSSCASSTCLPTRGEHVETNITDAALHTYDDTIGENAVAAERKHNLFCDYEVVGAALSPEMILASVLELTN